MKKVYLTLYLVILSILLLFSITWSQKAKSPAAKSDVLSIVVDQKPGSNNVVAKVNLSNLEKLSAIVCPLKYGNGKTPIVLDSVSFVNTRTEKFALKYPNIDPKTQKVNIALISTLSAADFYLPKGDGEVALLYFTLKKGATEASVTVDTALFPPANVLQLVDPQAKSIFPGFDNSKGKIMLLK